jgi:hypothetical protein
MRKVTAVAIVLGLALAAGCGDKDKDKATDETDETAQTPPTDEPPKDEPKVPDEPEDTMINKMANCPNAVEGATTEISDAEGAVVITVTVADEADEAAVAEVRKRAAALEAVDDATSDQVEHTGKGTGGGALGKCPVVMKDTSLALEEVEGGVKITVTPSDAANLETLKTEVTTRNDGMADAMKKAAAGGGEGGHGSGTGGGGGGGHDNH